MNYGKQKRIAAAVVEGFYSILTLAVLGLILSVTMRLVSDAGFETIKDALAAIGAGYIAALIYGRIKRAYGGDT